MREIQNLVLMLSVLVDITTIFGKVIGIKCWLGLSANLVGFL